MVADLLKILNNNTNSDRHFLLLEQSIIEKCHSHFSREAKFIRVRKLLKYEALTLQKPYIFKEIEVFQTVKPIMLKYYGLINESSVFQIQESTL